MSAAGSLARAGLIVSARSSSRASSATSASSSSPTRSRPAELDAFFAAFRIPDLIFQLVAAGALSSALIPIVSALFATDEQRAGVAGRVDGHQPDAHRPRRPRRSALFVLAPVIVPVITPGFEGPKLDRTIELTRIMLLSPIFLALGRGRDERPQRRRPVRRVGHRADRLQPRDHRRRADPRPEPRRRGPRHRRRRSARSATCSSSSGRWPGSASATTPRIDARRPAGAQGARR